MIEQYEVFLWGFSIGLGLAALALGVFSLYRSTQDTKTAVADILLYTHQYHLHNKLFRRIDSFPKGQVLSLEQQLQYHQALNGANEQMRKMGVTLRKYGVDVPEQGISYMPNTLEVVKDNDEHDRD